MSIRSRGALILTRYSLEFADLPGYTHVDFGELLAEGVFLSEEVLNIGTGFNWNVRATVMIGKTGILEI